MESSYESHLIFVEEPENHLSFSILDKLIGHFAQHHGGRQLITAIRSSFALNKFRLGSVVLFQRGYSFCVHNCPRKITSCVFADMTHCD
ncbi:hypothetical protein VSR68_40690 [Paraburkholderia phymatum]|uniref:hypothetical protein n=1 Tax=Paraburkholderia phymatum TaxID=148447 RepID=UPI00316B229D